LLRSKLITGKIKKPFWGGLFFEVYYFPLIGRPKYSYQTLPSAYAPAKIIIVIISIKYLPGHSNQHTLLT
jgi:hypothetical protein